MDEATSSLDADHEKQIKRIIENEAKDATTICIAHRLQTIISKDKIGVIDDGSLLEYDAPIKLLRNTQSQLYRLFGTSNKP